MLVFPRLSGRVRATHRRWHSQPRARCASDLLLRES